LAISSSYITNKLILLIHIAMLSLSKHRLERVIYTVYRPSLKRGCQSIAFATLSGVFCLIHRTCP